jgi:hypothetical protein
MNTLETSSPHWTAGTPIESVLANERGRCMGCSGTASAISRHPVLWFRTQELGSRRQSAFFSCRCPYADKNPHSRTCERWRGTPSLTQSSSRSHQTSIFTLGQTIEQRLTSSCSHSSPTHISQGWLFIPSILATAVTYAPDLTRKSGGKLGLGDVVPIFLRRHMSGGLFGVWGPRC